MNDYRNTSYKNIDFTIGDKKINFMKSFRLQHKTAWNIYNYVSNKSIDFNKSFRKIYHEKCAYCGVSIQVISSSNFEVDHFIPKFVLEFEKKYRKEHINGIDNLVSSCQMCNRGKQGFICTEEFQKILHPDNNHLIYVFDRKNDYSIEIQDEYKENEIIIDFYSKLKLNNQLRRLDYLIMEMKDFCDKHEGDKIVDEIQKLIIRIENKRRSNY